MKVSLWPKTTIELVWLETAIWGHLHGVNIKLISIIKHGGLKLKESLVFPIASPSIKSFAVQTSCWLLQICRRLLRCRKIENFLFLSQCTGLVAGHSRFAAGLNEPLNNLIRHLFCQISRPLFVNWRESNLATPLVRELYG